MKTKNCPVCNKFYANEGTPEYDRLPEHPTPCFECGNSHAPAGLGKNASNLFREFGGEMLKLLFGLVGFGLAVLIGLLIIGFVLSFICLGLVATMIGSPILFFGIILVLVGAASGK